MSISASRSPRQRENLCEEIRVRGLGLDADASPDTTDRPSNPAKPFRSIRPLFLCFSSASFRVSARACDDQAGQARPSGSEPAHHGQGRDPACPRATARAAPRIGRGNGRSETRRLDGAARGGKRQCVLRVGIATSRGLGLLQRTANHSRDARSRPDKCRGPQLPA